MAIQFNPNALSAFANVNFGNKNAIANLGGDNGLVQHGKLGSFLLKPFRSTENEDRNNAVRTELLKALGRAFQLEGVVEQNGRTQFTEEFMDRLSTLLGPAFKRGDFGIKGGEVKSGKPLTQRRIMAIFKAAATVKAETPYDAKTYAAKAASIEDVLKTKDPQAQSTLAGFEYVEGVKKTITLLESDLAGFDEECPNPGNLDRIQDWVIHKIKLAIYPDEIARGLEQAEPVPDPDDRPARRAQIKTYLRNRLEWMVKTTVDICLEAIEAGKFDDCMTAVSEGVPVLRLIERKLDSFSATLPSREVPDYEHQGGVDDDFGVRVVANDHVEQDGLDS